MHGMHPHLDMLLHLGEIPQICWEGCGTQLALCNTIAQVRKVIQHWGLAGFINSASPTGFFTWAAQVRLISRLELVAIPANLR